MTQPADGPPDARDGTRREWQGLGLGLIGVLLFSLTVPMTKLAVSHDTGTANAATAHALSPWFVTFGRAAVAGLLSVLYLWWKHQRGTLVRPQGSQWGLLAFNASGAVIGFPLFLALALEHVPSTHAAVVTGLLPLVTAVAAAVWYRQRPSGGFWACSVAGCALVVGFMLMRAGGLHLHLADLFLVIAMVWAAVMYVGGARLTPSLGAESVICWMLVISLPLTLPLAWWFAPEHTVPQSRWWAFAYVSLFSMWLGFFAWYRGLALGGPVRVSQVQLLQPFSSLVFAVPLLGEQIDGGTLLFALAVIATVFAGKRMSVGQITRPSADGSPTATITSRS
ncbi:MAG: DMT family transporter [Betaproteobacteria bacterium]|nr:DMT family transporter [Betaproteobacteria bacterium]